MGILSLLGLTRPANPPATIDPIGSTDWEEKFKTAVKDLAARDDELDDAEKRIEGLIRDAATRAKWNKDISDRLTKAEAEIAALRPDAEKFRAKAKADAERKKSQRAAAKKAVTK